MPAIVAALATWHASTPASVTRCDETERPVHGGRGAGAAMDDEPGAQPQTPELDSDAVQQIMAHCDAAALCACAETCRLWYRLAVHHAAWQSLAASDFGLYNGVRDWRRAYAVCQAAARSIPPATLFDRRLPPCAVVAPLDTMPPLLRPRAFACSDRRCEFGAYFPPTAALVGVGPVSSCWCTSTGLNRHVSILLDLGTISLVTAIGIVNSPDDGFDNPVRANIHNEG